MLTGLPPVRGLIVRGARGTPRVEGPPRAHAPPARGDLRETTAARQTASTAPANRTHGSVDARHGLVPGECPVGRGGLNGLPGKLLSATDTDSWQTLTEGLTVLLRWVSGPNCGIGVATCAMSGASGMSGRR